MLDCHILGWARAHGIEEDSGEGGVWCRQPPPTHLNKRKQGQRLSSLIIKNMFNSFPALLELTKLTATIFWCGDALWKPKIIKPSLLAEPQGSHSWSCSLCHSKQLWPLLQLAAFRAETQWCMMMEVAVLFIPTSSVSHENYLYFHYPVINIWVSMVTQLQSVSGCRPWDGLAKPVC